MVEFSYPIYAVSMNQFFDSSFVILCGHFDCSRARTEQGEIVSLPDILIDILVLSYSWHLIWHVLQSLARDFRLEITS